MAAWRTWTFLRGHSRPSFLLLTALDTYATILWKFPGSVQDMPWRTNDALRADPRTLLRAARGFGRLSRTELR